MSTDKLRTLTVNEATVLYWTCKGLKYHQMTDKLSYGVVRITQFMAGVYQKLEFPKDAHWTVRRKLLKEYCPQLNALIEGNPANLKNFPLVIEQTTEPSIEPTTEETPLPPPEITAIVLYDEQKEEEQEKREKEPIIIYPQPISNLPWRPAPGPIVAAAGVSMLTVCGICAVLLVAAYIFRNNFIPAIPAPTRAISATLPLTEPTTMPIEVPTITSLPPTEAPHDTPLPPTETISVKDFYNQGEWAALRDSVYVRMTPDFETASSGTCAPPNPGFAVTLEIHNTGGQFLIRFDPSAFEAQDDLGNKYTLEGAGINVCDAVGIQAYPATSYEYLRLKFAGQVPLGAQYLIITADSLSGVKVVFHKEY